MHSPHTELAETSDVRGAVRGYMGVRTDLRKAYEMSMQTREYPTPYDLDRIMARARKEQAETIAAGFRALMRWIARPNLRARHA